MAITFEKGDEDNPKGHALIYFRSSSDPEEIWGTYLVLLPITVDVSKYVPPFLMNQIGDVGPKDLSAFAFPPAPEQLESYQYLEALADMRDDDVLFAGNLNPTDVAAGMMAVNEAVQQYAELYTRLAESRLPSQSVEETASEGFGVNEVLYGLMSDRDRLNELTKLVGRLRFAVEGGEETLAKEAEVEINLLSRYLPENHRTSRLIEAVKNRESKSERLADLYLQRCFHMVLQEYVELGEIEEEIRTLEGDDSSS